MIIQRLKDLEEILEIEYAKLGEYQKEESIISDVRQKIEITQRINHQILPNLRKHQEEYWQLLEQLAASVDFNEAEASAAIDEMVEALEQMRSNTTGSSEEVNQFLEKILNKLNEPGQPTSSKLKAAISTIPPFLSLTYEAEVDVEKALRKIFPASKLVKKKSRSDQYYWSLT